MKRRCTRVTTFLLWAWALVFLVLLPPALIGRYLPALSGWLRPVVEPARLVAVERLPHGAVAITTRTRKLRACTPRRVEWLLSEAGRDPVELTPSYGRRVANNLVGATVTTGPTVLPVSIEEVQTGLYGYVWHSCHPWALWDTRSLYYQPQPVTADLLDGSPP